VTGRRAFRSAPLAGTAAIGVMVGHWLAYDVAIPGSGARSEILAATGHSWWELGLKIAALLAAVGVGALVASRVAARTDATGVERWSFVATRLIPLQLVAFLGMEAAERVAAGAPLAGLLDHHVLLLGLAFQVITSVAGAVLLTCFDRTVVRVVAAIRSAKPAVLRPQTVAIPPSIVVLRSRLLTGAAGVRGPPRS
jgi:hypothetical protein